MSPDDHRLSDFASASSEMRELVRISRRVAAADSSVLIQGETGVGKEWLARAIHAEGGRANRPFVGVNVAAIPDTLLESELFGHEKGAFTGATQARRGHFELAHRGTLFLDEIGDMAPALQAKLLRALQERCIHRLGGEEAIAVDIRLMAATHEDLEKSMAAGRFRPDLYYRLGVVVLDIPPLRERREDIPALADHYLTHFQHRLGRSLEGIEEEALAALTRYSWPGNVRELVNLMERAVLLATGPKITLADLPLGLTGPSRTAVLDDSLKLPDDWRTRPWKELRQEALQRLERSYLAAQLLRTGGHVARTAKQVGITPRALHGKMKALGLRKEDFHRKD